MYSRRSLAEDFRRLGVMNGETIMLHASVRAVGPVAGGPDMIHLALKDALTERGTLMMLAGCPSHYDEVGRGNLTPEQEAEVLEKLPPFDPSTARADRSNGTLVEFLRTYPGTRVNPHVARFAAWGERAGHLLAGTPWNHAFGTGSALARLHELDGRILLLGSDHDAVTFLHYAEFLADIADKRVARFKVPVAEEGRRVWREMIEFDSSNGAHAHWPERFFALIVDSFLRKSANSGGPVGHARSFLLSARQLLDFALPIMEAVGRDPRAADGLRELR
jgi:aminoglycoside 3-N-acetyltransferase